MNAASGAKFYDCEGQLSTLKSEEQVTEKLRTAREDEGAKFSSSCLEYVLLRNWAQPAEYLLEEYFP